MAPAPVAARQFEKLWVLGYTTGPALAVITTLANAYVAYHLDPKSLAFKLSLAASSLAPIIYSVTWAFMEDINQKLFAKAKTLGSSSPVDKGLDAGLPKSETTHGLIQVWGNRHLVRSSLAAVSSILAIWAALVAR
ncbi:hypothetical protein DL95DRAFT_472800 [Leptodontidium sp. 2 PMI_412]|nr:hypothetical protein DL95DRAFT_472800 [Leptodontidium sp. 2 PMI_412]